MVRRLSKFPIVGGIEPNRELSVKSLKKKNEGNWERKKIFFNGGEKSNKKKREHLFQLRKPRKNRIRELTIKVVSWLPMKKEEKKMRERGEEKKKKNLPNSLQGHLDPCHKPHQTMNNKIHQTT